MKNKNNKPIFFCGLGEQPSAYKSLSKFLNIIPIDWNKIKIPKFKADTAVGFSMGAILACEYAIKNKVKNLILCSMTTGVESLEKIKSEKIIFLIGEKEKWVIKDTKRVLKTVKNRAKIIIVPKADHKIDRNYQKKLLEVIHVYT
jgi:alpha/beta superfamily hydrolase